MKTPKRIFLSSVDELAGSVLPPDAGGLHVFNNFSLGYRLNPKRMLDRIIQPDTPYRIDDYRFFLFHKADIDIMVNLQTTHIDNGNIGFMGNGGIVQYIEKLPDDICVSAMILQYDFLRYLMNGHLGGGMGRGLHKFTVNVTPEQFTIAEQILATIYSLTGEPDYNEQAVEALIAAFAHYFMGLYENDIHNRTASPSRADSVFNEFIALVNDNCATQHNLDFYADRLCLTQRYLGVLVRQSSGVTAKQWIDRAIIAQAKVALRHSDVTIASLADSLGFPNAPFFSKYFKRLTGLTPSAFRHG